RRAWSPPEDRGICMLLRTRLLASASILTALFCAGVWAQTPPEPAQPSPGSGEPAPTTTTAPEPGGTEIPEVRVTAPRERPPKPTAPAPRRKPTVQSTLTPAAAAPPAPAPPSPYQTGAPNVAGGAPVVPQLASQMTVSGEELNARPVAETGQIL